MLFITNLLPYPPISGGRIKSWKLAVHFSNIYDLRFACPVNEDDKIFIPKFLESTHIHQFYFEEFKRDRSAFNLLKSYIRGETLNIYRSYHKNLKLKIEAWCTDADIIFVDHYEMFPYVPENVKAKVILHEHNAEYMLWKRSLKVVSNPFKKLMIALESIRIKKAEKLFCEKSDLILAAPKDITNLSSLGVSLNKFSETLHLGYDEMLSLPDVKFKDTKKALFFVGTLTWEANIDGLLWFLQNIWPQLKEQNDDLIFNIVGKSPDERLVRCVSKCTGVKLTGFQADLLPFYEMSRIFVAPLRFGSGIKVKILNAMYRGIPIVTTTTGVESIDARNGEELFYSDNEQDWVTCINRLINEEDTWVRLQSNSRFKAKQKYSWSNMLAKHCKKIDELITNQAK